MRILYKNKILEVEQKKTKRLKKPFTIIKSKNAVAIIPLLGNKIVLEKQYRAAVGKFLYEIPAGKIEKGETPKEAAERELKEETGYEAGTIRHVFSGYSSPGYLTEKLDFYLAKNLKKGRTHRDSDEIISLRIVPISRALEMIKRHEIVDIKTIAAILFCNAYIAC
ncbi:MAG: NUDIX hydrolase [Candidatus Micrarchaeia archaeon]